MNVKGLDALDNKILNVIKDNAKAIFSEIGELVGLSRVAVKNRMEAMEEKGIIQGYKTVINPSKVPQGVQCIIDVEVFPDYYEDVVDVLGSDKYLHKVYKTTGECRIHAIGIAPSIATLEKHVNEFFKNVKGVRRVNWNLLLATIKTLMEASSMLEESKKIFKEIMEMVPGMDFMEMKKQKGGRFKFPMYINDRMMRTDLEALELSMRSSNSLHRAGYQTIGNVVQAIERPEDLKKIRNCGEKSVNEIMEKLFCYQYVQLDKARRVKYIKRIVEINL